MLIKRTLQWLGHVARMPGHRYPTLVLDCVPVGGKRGQGRPAATFRHAYARMLKAVGADWGDRWLDEINARAQDRVSWRAWVKGLELPEPPAPPAQSTRAHLSRSCNGGS